MTRLMSLAVAAGISAAVLAGLAMRLWMVANRTLTFDEAATAYFAALPMAELWGAHGRLETNPPLFYSLAAILSRLGLPAEQFRIASILPDAGTIVVAALLARSLAGPRADPWAAISAALLVAGSATLVEVSLEARAYALLALLGLLALHLCVLALREGRWRWLAVLGVVEVLALYTHNLATLMVGALNLLMAICLLAGLAHGQPLLRRWIVVQGFVLLGWSPWLPTVFLQVNGRLAQFWIPVPSLGGLRYAVQEVMGLPTLSWPQPWADLLFMALGVLGTTLLVRRPGWRRWVGVGLVGAILAGVPLVTWAISQWRPLMNGRALLWLVPVHIVLVAVALGRMRAAGLALAAGLAAAQVATIPFWRPTGSIENWPLVTAVLRAHMRPGDAILIQPYEADLMLRHYGWDGGPYAVFGIEDGPWYRAFAGEIIPRGGPAGGIAPGRRLWVVTRRDAPGHAATLDRVAAGREAVRVLPQPRVPTIAVDVSVLEPR